MAQCPQRDWHKITADFSLETMQGKRIQKGIFRMLKEKNCQSRIHNHHEISKQPKSYRRKKIIKKQRPMKLKTKNKREKYFKPRAGPLKRLVKLLNM